MNLTDEAHIDAFNGDLGAAAGVIGGVVLDCGVACLLDTQTLQNCFQLALQGEEGLACTVGAQNQHLGLFGQCLTFHGQVDLS